MALDSDRIAIGNPRSKRSSTPGKQYSYKWFIIFVVEKSNGGGGGGEGRQGTVVTNDHLIYLGNSHPTSCYAPPPGPRIPLAVYVRLRSFGSKANN